jgi:hypothetical protein
MGSEPVRRVSHRARWRAAMAPLMVALAVASRGPIALGQDARPEPSEADRDAARKLMDEGRAKERAGDKDGALEAYLAADRIMGVPTTGLSVAQAALALDKLVEARDVLLRVSRHPTSLAEPLPFARARLEAKEMAARLDRRIPSLALLVTGVASGVPVMVTVDGVGVPPEALQFPRAVNPGKRVVAASATGYRTARKTVIVAEGEQATVSLAMEPGQDEPEQGGLTLEGTSPLVWVGLGVTVVGLGVGIATGVLALSRSSDLESACPDYGCPPSRQSDIDSMTTLSHISTVSFVVAGAGAVLGVVALSALSDWSGAPPAGEPSPAAPTVSLAAGPGALLLRGRF